MSNSNCLEGMRCPACDSYGPFIIDTNSQAEWHDDGVEFFNCSFEENSKCVYVSCDHHDEAHMFRENSGQKIN